MNVVYTILVYHAHADYLLDHKPFLSFIFARLTMLPWICTSVMVTCSLFTDDASLGGVGVNKLYLKTLIYYFDFDPLFRLRKNHLSKIEFLLCICQSQSQSLKAKLS